MALMCSRRGWMGVLLVVMHAAGILAPGKATSSCPAAAAANGDGEIGQITLPLLEIHGGWKRATVIGAKGGGFRGRGGAWATTMSLRGGKKTAPGEEEEEHMTPIAGMKRSRRLQGISPELKSVSPSVLSARKKRRPSGAETPGGGSQTPIQIKLGDAIKGDKGAFSLPPDGVGTARRLFQEMGAGMPESSPSPRKSGEGSASPTKASPSPPRAEQVEFCDDAEKYEGDIKEQKAEEVEPEKNPELAAMARGLAEKVKEGVISQKEADVLLEEEAAMRADPEEYARMNKELVAEGGLDVEDVDDIDSSDIPMMSGYEEDLVGEEQEEEGGGGEEEEEEEEAGRVQDGGAGQAEEGESGGDDDEDEVPLMGPWIVRFPSIGELAWVALRAEGAIHDDNLEPVPVQVVFLPPSGQSEGAGGKEEEEEPHILIQELVGGVWKGHLHQERTGGKLVASLKGAKLATSLGALLLSIEWGEGTPVVTGQVGKTKFEEVLEENVLQRVGEAPSTEEFLMLTPAEAPAAQADDGASKNAGKGGRGQGVLETGEGGADDDDDSSMEDHMGAGKSFSPAPSSPRPGRGKLAPQMGHGEGGESGDALLSMEDHVGADEEDEDEEGGERGAGRPAKTNLLVLGNSKTTSKADIRMAFKDCGSIQYVRLLRNKGKKDAFAFSGDAIIEFLTEEGMRLGLALSKSGLTINDRVVTCKVAKTVVVPVLAKNVEEQGEGCTVYVRGLPYSAREADVRQTFSDIAPIVSLRLPLNKMGTFAGYCFVEYKNSRAAAEAITRMNGKEWQNPRDGTKRKLDVQMCKKAGGTDLNKRFIWGNKSKNIVVNKVRTSASRSKQDNSFNGYLIATTPVQGGRWWELQILESSKRTFNGGIEVGVTVHASNPNNSSLSLPAAGTWLIRDTHPSDSDHSLHLYPGGASFGMATLNYLDEIRLMYDRGTLSVLVNGKKQGVAFTGLPDKVYPCVNLFGRCTGVRIVGQGSL